MSLVWLNRQTMKYAFRTHVLRQKSLKQTPTHSTQPTHPFLDLVLGAHLGLDPLSRHVRRPESPDDERVGDAHDEDREEVEHDRDERVVEGARRVLHVHDRN